MRRRLFGPSLFPGGISSLTILKISTIILPAIFIFLIDLLRRTLFHESRPMLPGDLVVFAVVLGASFLFSGVVYKSLTQVQEQNERRIRELATINEISQSITEIRDCRPSAIMGHN